MPPQVYASTGLAPATVSTEAPAESAMPAAPVMTTMPAVSYAQVTMPAANVSYPSASAPVPITMPQTTTMYAPMPMPAASVAYPGVMAPISYTPMPVTIPQVSMGQYPATTYAAGAYGTTAPPATTYAAAAYGTYPDYPTPGSFVAVPGQTPYPGASASTGSFVVTGFPPNMDAGQYAAQYPNMQFMQQPPTIYYPVNPAAMAPAAMAPEAPPAPTASSNPSSKTRGAQLEENKASGKKGTSSSKKGKGSAGKKKKSCPCC